MPLSKQLLSFAKSQRVNFEPEFVHQIILKEQLDELAAAPNFNVGAFLSFLSFFDICQAFEEH